MNKTVKNLTILLTASLLLVGCGPKEEPKSTVQTSTKATTKATTESSTKAKTKDSSTDEVKKEDSRAGAQKTVLEASDEAGKSTVTLYYKGDTLLVQEKVDDYNISKMGGDNPLEEMKEAVAISQEKFKDLMGNGFELTSEYKDGIFYIYNTIDYTKIDLQKLKEIVPGFNPLNDSTVSYSVTKESLINSGMVEK
ncbi:DUF1307 domain-containing protein [Streptococcus sp. 343_SSPC]|uniref:DUF1307 domain-containing protein n=1 Tax=Streptococcus sp. 343_SSPC TaxID=1579342 RepID=UPI0006615820|nr:DUF1307 domain-containing protein [Streptococcus sp. 343_SSPC]